MAELKWDGARVRVTIESAVFEGMVIAGEHLLGVAKERAPHEEGKLAESGTCTTDEGEGKIAVAFDRVYARRQHEELTWRHDEGKTAKYLENPMHEERETMEAIIAHVAGNAV